MKKDIFHGKIKKEYFSYIFVYMIFFVLLFVGVGALCVYASICGMTTNTYGERLLIASFGVIAFVLAGVYVFLELLVIRNFPNYKKIRRILFNSDIYFTDSTSNEYFGGSRTLRGRRNKAAFDLVTSFVEVEKGMGNKKPIQYKIYSVIATLMAVLGLVIPITMLLLLKNGIILPRMSDDVFAFCSISGGVVCIAFAIFFLARAYKVALISPFEKDKWKFEVYTSLTDIAVRKNNKKHKFWYDKDQLEQIAGLVKSASENAELKLKTKGNKLISFTVVDTLDSRVVFTGLFI